MRRTRTRRQNRQKTKLGLPDLEHVKSAVLVSLRSPESQRSYRRSIDDFVCWYCSEPRLSFNKTVVTRYRIHLEDKLLAPGTINVRLAAVRRLAYEAADTGLLSPDLAAGIRRVKGAKKLGMRLGNWLTVEEARALWQLPNMHSVKGKRDRAILAVLLGCGLRRRELIDLTLDHIQRREDHWAILDLVGKGGHIRTVPMPDWVKQAIDHWLSVAQIARGRIFRCVCRRGVVWGTKITEKVVWHVVKEYAERLGVSKLARTICGGRALGSVMIREASWSKSSFCSVMSPCRRRRNTMCSGTLCRVAVVSACRSIHSCLITAHKIS
jgi:site-specific recombinase XerD